MLGDQPDALRLLEASIIRPAPSSHQAPRRIGPMVSKETFHLELMKRFLAEAERGGRFAAEVLRDQSRDFPVPGEGSRP